MIRAGMTHRAAFITLVEDINLFEFEDRKLIQTIVCELLAHESGNNELVIILREKGHLILERLLSQYDNTDNVSFVGKYLQTFTQYPALLKCWCNLNHIVKLLRMILNNDFIISGDAIENFMVSLVVIVRFLSPF